MPKRTRKQNINSNLMMFAILGISFMTVLNNAVMIPIMADIEKAYPNASSLMIQNLMTLPSLAIIIAMLLIYALEKWITPKKILIIGLSIFIIAGIALANQLSIQAFLLVRLLLGVGVGFITPYVYTLTVNYFTGDKQTKLLGYSNTARSTGGIVATIFSGVIAVYYYNFSFLVYTLAIIPLIIIIFIMDNEKIEKLEIKYKMNEIFSKRIIYILLVQIVVIIVTYIYVTNISLLLSELKIPNVEMTSVLVIVIYNLANILGSILFFYLYKTVKSKLNLSIVICFILSYFILMQTTTLSGVIIGSILIGFSFGVLMPLIIKELTDAIRIKELAIVVFIGQSISLFAGQFLSPFVTGILKNSFHLHGTTGAFACGILLTILYYFLVILYMRKFKINQR